MLVVAATLVGILAFRSGLINRSKKYMLGAIAIPVVCAILQASIEHPRWQLAPCYISVCALLTALISQFRTTGSERQLPRLLKQFVPFNCLLATIAAVLCLLIPIVQLPVPTGPYRVGTVSFQLKDNNRREIFCKDAKEKRRVMIQVWYPAGNSGGQLAPFMPYCPDVHPFLSAPIWSVVASHLWLISTNSRISAPILRSQLKFPVLIFSHGIMGGRIQNTTQAEELASRGYIVVGIDHTYDASFTILSDNENIPSGLLSNSLGPEENTVVKVRDNGLAVRVADTRFVLDELTRLNNSDSLGVLANSLDLERVGIFGHSFGGATTIVTCAVDKRFKAGLAMDGCIADEQIRSINRPLFVMQAPRSGDDPIGVKRLSKKVHAPFWAVTIDGTAHGNFTDLAFLSPAHRLSLLTGSIDQRRALRIINAYTIAFFDFTLLGKHSALLDGPSKDYPEVSFDSKNVAVEL